jgi:hypothetical protein
MQQQEVVQNGIKDIDLYRYCITLLETHGLISKPMCAICRKETINSDDRWWRLYCGHYIHKHCFYIYQKFRCYGCGYSDACLVALYNLDIQQDVALHPPRPSFVEDVMKRYVRSFLSDHT